MSGLDYPYTCPDLDALVNQARAEIENYVNSTFIENNPILEVYCNLPKEIQDKLDTESLYLYDLLEPLFEGSRKINEDIRSAADHQISELQDRISDLEHEVEVLE